MGGACVLLAPSIIKLFQLLHLNQAGIQHFISNLTDAQACPLKYFFASGDKTDSASQRYNLVMKLDWHLITIEILKNVMLSRREREEKPRIDYIGLAIEIVNDLRERH